MGTTEGVHELRRKQPDSRRTGALQNRPSLDCAGWANSGGSILSPDWTPAFHRFVLGKDGTRATVGSYRLRDAGVRRVGRWPWVSGQKGHGNGRNQQAHRHKNRTLEPKNF